VTPNLDRLPPRETAARPPPLATIRAYRRTGCAIVTIERAGRAPHRHRVSLRRYAALLREWTLTAAARRWRASGAWLRSNIAVSLREVRS
jgi:hypothetical protein